MEFSEDQSEGKFVGTVLVTGGCGFVGSFITEAFATELSCSHIVVASRNPSRFRVPGVEYRSCDVMEFDQVKTLLDEIKPRVIVHTVSPGVFAPSYQ